MLIIIPPALFLKCISLSVLAKSSKKKYQNELVPTRQRKCELRDAKCEFSKIRISHFLWCPNGKWRSADTQHTLLVEDLRLFTCLDRGGGNWKNTCRLILLGSTGIVTLTTSHPISRGWIVSGRAARRGEETTLRLLESGDLKPNRGAANRGLADGRLIPCHCFGGPCHCFGGPCHCFGGRSIFFLISSGDLEGSRVTLLGRSDLSSCSSTRSGSIAGTGWSPVCGPMQLSSG